MLQYNINDCQYKLVIKTKDEPDAAASAGTLAR